jgi:hypothetical protein
MLADLGGASASNCRQNALQGLSSAGRGRRPCHCTGPGLMLFLSHPMKHLRHLLTQDSAVSGFQNFA